MTSIWASSRSESEASSRKTVDVHITINGTQISAEHTYPVVNPATDQASGSTSHDARRRGSS